MMGDGKMGANGSRHRCGARSVFGVEYMDMYQRGRADPERMCVWENVAGSRWAKIVRLLEISICTEVEGRSAMSDWSCVISPRPPSQVPDLPSEREVGNFPQGNNSSVCYFARGWLSDYAASFERATPGGCGPFSPLSACVRRPGRERRHMFACRLAGRGAGASSEGSQSRGW